PVRLPVRPHHEAALHGGESGAPAHRLRRGRGRARAARRADRGGRGPRASDPRRPAAGSRAAPRAPGLARAPGPGLRARQSGVRHYAAMNALILPARIVFICDTYVADDPDAEHIAEMTLLAAEEVRRFGIAPRIALLSASNFGSVDTPSARKMRAALGRIAERAPELEIEGEMHGDAALSEEIRLKVFPRTRLRGEANLLVMPTLDA